MKNLNRLNNFSFATIATALIVTAGLVIGLSMPAIKTWQIKNVDILLEQGKSSSDETSKSSLYAQAALLGKNDPLATYTYANYLWQKGEYEKAIDTYNSSWLELDYNYLGELALKSGNASKAKEFYSKYDAEGENAESLSGLAIIEFINGNNSKGCELARKAIKLNLSSQNAEQALAICDIKNSSSSLNDRQQAYTLLNSFLYIDALDKLQKVETKNSSDWMAIAAIYASSGKLEDSKRALESALKQSPADMLILQKLIDNLKAQGKTGESEIYKLRLEDIQFKNFPNN